MKSTYIYDNQLGAFSLENIIGGASKGAAAGSIVPGVGTAVGGAIGGLVETISSFIGGGDWWGDHLSGETQAGTLAAAIDRFERASGQEAKSIAAQVVQKLQGGSTLKEIEYYIDAQLGYPRNIADNTGRKWKAVRKQIRRVQQAMQQSEANPVAMGVSKVKKSGMLWPVIIGIGVLGGGLLLAGNDSSK